MDLALLNISGMRSGVCVVFTADFFGSGPCFHDSSMLMFLCGQGHVLRCMCTCVHVRGGQRTTPSVVSQLPSVLFFSFLSFFLSFFVFFEMGVDLWPLTQEVGWAGL